MQIRTAIYELINFKQTSNKRPIIGPKIACRGLLIYEAKSKITCTSEI